MQSTEDSSTKGLHTIETERLLGRLIAEDLRDV